MRNRILSTNVYESGYLMHSNLSSILWQNHVKITVMLVHVISLSTAIMTLGIAPKAAAEPEPVYVADLSVAMPQSGLSEDTQLNTWRLLPYKSDEIQGTLIYAPSFVNAPELTLPLGVSGWHHIRLGLWQPNFSYDGKTTIRVKLSGAEAFRPITPPASNDSQKSTFLREIYFRADDLSGKDLIIRKMNGLIGRGCALAYVKLDPIDPEDVEAIKMDRAQQATRNLVATIDGVSYFHYSEVSRPEDVLDQVELYRHSDVAKVLWAVNYGDRTNFPTEVPGAVFLGDHNRSALSVEAGANDYLRGEQQAHRSLRDLAAVGVTPHALAAEHAHEMGLEFDLMFRLGILGGLGFLDLADNGFFAEYPHCRQVLADGTVLDKASYAFEETQDFTLALMREALAGVDADGINLCYVRGPHALQYEQPVPSSMSNRCSTPFKADIRRMPERWLPMTPAWRRSARLS